jgi:hypothetical protein
VGRIEQCGYWLAGVLPIVLYFCPESNARHLAQLSGLTVKKYPVPTQLSSACTQVHCGLTDSHEPSFSSKLGAAPNSYDFGKTRVKIQIRMVAGYRGSH